MSLNKGKLPAKLVEGIIDNGELKTMSEWAEKFKVKKSQIQATLSKLRKKGFMLSPIGTIRDPYHGSKEGKVVNILDSIHHSREKVAQNNKQEIIPRLKSQFRLLEEMISKWPQLISEARTEANSYMKFLINKEEELKQLPDKPYEDPRNRTKED